MKAVAVLLVLCYLAVSHAWKCGDAPRLYNAVQIDAGQGQVVARDTSSYVYFLIGAYWRRMTTSVRFRHVSVGPAGLWGSGTTNKVYKYVAGNFLPSTGVYMKQVDAGGDDHVVGVTTSSRAYCLRSTYASAFRGGSSLSWSSQSRVMKYISCGPLYGCWGVDTRDQIYFTRRITPTTCATSGWSRISGSAKVVEVGTDGSVFVVNRQGLVFQRTGIFSRRPQGSRWTQIPMCMSIRHVSYDLGRLWAVTTSGLLLKCTH